MDKKWRYEQYKLRKPQHSPEDSLALEHGTPREVVSPAVAHPEQCGLTGPPTAGAWLENPVAVPREYNSEGPHTWLLLLS